MIDDDDDDDNNDDDDKNDDENIGDEVGADTDWITDDFI